MSEDLYEYDSEGTDGSDAVIEVQTLASKRKQGLFEKIVL